MFIHPSLLTNVDYSSTVLHLSKIAAEHSLIHDDRKLSLCEKKNVGMIQQCQNKNLTKDDTNKVQVSACLHLCYTMFTPMFTPTLTQRMIQTKCRKMYVLE